MAERNLSICLSMVDYSKVYVELSEIAEAGGALADTILKSGPAWS